MASTSIVLGGIFILALIILGTYQSLHIPHSTLAGAATVDVKPKTQQELNICMIDCMRTCVTQEGMEQECLNKCNPKCGA